MQLCSVIRDTDHECLSCGKQPRTCYRFPWHHDRVTPWHGGHGDTTPAPRHGVGSRLDSCVAHQDGKPQTAQQSYGIQSQKPTQTKCEIISAWRATNGIHNKKEMRPETVLPPRKQRHCCLSQHAEPLVCRPPAIHRWFVTRHLKYQSPDCVSWIQSTCYQFAMLIVFSTLTPV